jgi:hypothetical protein
VDVDAADPVALSAVWALVPHPRRLAAVPAMRLPGQRRVNAKAKGSRNERRSRALLERAGYRVTRSGGSLGVWDLIGIGPADVVLVQVKTTRPPSPTERVALTAFPVPQGTRKLVHRWRDRQRHPDVQEL